MRFGVCRAAFSPKPGGFPLACPLAHDMQELWLALARRRGPVEATMSCQAANRTDPVDSRSVIARLRSALLWNCRALPAIAASLVAWGTASAATTHDASPETYRNLLRQLRAGDTLLLAAGEYRGGLALHGLSGEPDRPITITGPADGPPATLIAHADQNTVSILDSHHVVLKNLVLDGRGLPVDAVKSEGHARYAHHITLAHLSFAGHGDLQRPWGSPRSAPPGTG